MSEDIMLIKKPVAVVKKEVLPSVFFILCSLAFVVAGVWTSMSSYTKYSNVDTIADHIVRVHTKLGGRLRRRHCCANRARTGPTAKRRWRLFSPALKR